MLSRLVTALLAKGSSAIELRVHCYWCGKGHPVKSMTVDSKGETRILILFTRGECQ